MDREWLLVATGFTGAMTMMYYLRVLLRWLRGNQAFDAYAASLPDQYFYLTFSMAVTGIVTVLKWDSIFLIVATT